MKKVVVLVGAPAVGKSTLAEKLEAEHGFYRFSFDELYPLNKLDQIKSKAARKQLLEIVASCDHEWIIADDTTHMHSMQKRYFTLQAAVCLLYISVEVNQITDLLERNSQRKTSVIDRDILNICNHLMAHPPINRNLLQFNFTSIPVNIGNILKGKLFEIESTPLLTIPLELHQPNALHELNNRLNAAIHAAFQKNSQLNGKLVSAAKKSFLSLLSDASFSDLDELVEEFTLTNLS